MSKRSLGVIAIILIFLMAVVAMAGLDNLPRSLRSSSTQSIEQLAAAREQHQANRSQVLALLASDPSLFRSQEARFRARLDAAKSKIDAASAEESRLKQLLAANRRSDRETAQAALDRLDRTRKEALDESLGILAEAKQWVDYKKRTPELLTELQTRVNSVRAFDLESAVAPARRAEVDWPGKKADLEGRIAAVAALKARADEVWNSTADARSKAEAGDYGAVDYGALVGGLRTLQDAENSVKQSVDTINAMAAQLYVGRDKVLLDLEDESSKRQRVRVVQTKYKDATLRDPQVTEEERWENVDDERFRQLERAINMVVERKAPGKYDIEADKQIQPPGYAYIAPAGQSNQYGSWQNGVWSWLPQYLILSQLLRGPSYPPVRMDDYYNYDRSRRSGNTWYGRYGRTWNSGGYRGGGSGVGGALRHSMENWTRGRDSDTGVAQRPRERWSWGGSGGSYSGSRYQNRGSYGGSRYQSRPSSGGFGSRSYSRGWGGGGFGRRGGRR